MDVEERVEILEEKINVLISTNATLIDALFKKSVIDPNELEKDTLHTYKIWFKEKGGLV